MVRRLFIAAAFIACAVHANAQPALRTNLLADVVLTPNIGLIVPVSNKLSVEGDFAYSHWRTGNLFALQLARGGVGMKYWFGPRKERKLTGWNAGLYALYCGRFDVQWRDGWQGDGFWSAGLSAGYAAPISKRLSLEFLVGAGYLRTSEARHYHRPEQGHLMWQKTVRHAGRVTLTKAQINLVWSLRKNPKNPKSK